LYLTLGPVGEFSVNNSQTVSDTNGTHNSSIYKQQRISCGAIEAALIRVAL